MLWPPQIGFTGSHADQATPSHGDLTMQLRLSGSALQALQSTCYIGILNDSWRRNCLEHVELGGQQKSRRAFRSTRLVKFAASC